MYWTSSEERWGSRDWVRVSVGRTDVIGPMCMEDCCGAEVGAEAMGEVTVSRGEPPGTIVI